MAENEILMDEDEAAALLKLKSQTLSKWRMDGKYNLPFIRMGRAIRYRKSDLLAWLESRTVGGATNREKQTA